MTLSLAEQAHYIHEQLNALHTSFVYPIGIIIMQPYSYPSEFFISHEKAHAQVRVQFCAHTHTHAVAGIPRLPMSEKKCNTGIKLDYNRTTNM